MSERTTEYIVKKKFDKISPAVFLIGKAFSYRLNALIDSQIAYSILKSYYEGQEVKGVTEEARSRTGFFLSVDISDREKYLLSVAFTQYYANAYWDVMYPQLIETAFPASFGNTIKKALLFHFDSIAGAGMPGLMVFRTRPLWYSKFARRSLSDLRKGDFRLIKNHFLRKFRIRPARGSSNALSGHHFSSRDIFFVSYKLVQKLNKMHNEHVKKEFGSLDSEKTAAIRAASRHFSRPDAFVAGALDSQVSAGRWDRLSHALLDTFFWKSRNIEGQENFLEYQGKRYRAFLDSSKD